ncbi:MAG TPA: META domain-containing protein [Ornithinibacter sp.]|nr:META domain-containing protein [Ornithinibacter sp.]
MPAQQSTHRAGLRAPRTRDGARLWRTAIAGVVAGLLLAGCGGGGADLAGSTYTSTEVRGHDLVEGSQVTLTFEDGRISANAGCNTMSGPATWDGETLEVEGPLASTMMACEEPLMEQDTWVSDFLTSSPALAVDGDELTLGDDSTGMTLTRAS